MKKLLIVDDDQAVTNYLTVFLMQTEQYEPVVVNDPRGLSDLLDRFRFDAILLDMDMPHVSGMDVLKLVKEREIGAPVIVLTGVNDADLAVRSLRLGAVDYLTKPVEDERLLEVIDRAIRQRALDSTLSEIPTQPTREGLAFEEVFENLPTRNATMIRIFHQAEKMAAGDLSIFIFGENGTGKETLARAIHAASPRRKNAFVAVDVAAHTPDAFPAVFFGQGQEWQSAKKEHPGFVEEAAGGTLFLNNVEKLALPMQIRLNRLIQSKEFYRESSTKIHAIDVRIIAASCKDLTSEKHGASFSPELLHYLMIHSIRLPALRERPDDIPLLAERFVAAHAKSAGKPIRGINEELTGLLGQYQFRGNLRELHDILAMAVQSTEGETVGLQALSPYMREILLAGQGGAGDFRIRPLREVEREHVLRTLQVLGGDRKMAALALGITEEVLDTMFPSDEE